MEKRIRLAVPLQVSKLQEPASAERTFTENVSSHGARVLARGVMQPDERLKVSLFEGYLQTQARVVYCQRLPDGRFGVGLQFQGVEVNWSRSPWGGAGGWR